MPVFLELADESALIRMYCDVNAASSCGADGSRNGSLGAGRHPLSAVRDQRLLAPGDDARRAMRVALLELELAGRVEYWPTASQSNEVFSWCSPTAGSSDSSSARLASGTPQVRTNVSLSAFAIARK
jgi:hypothetical protein